MFLRRLFVLAVFAFSVTALPSVSNYLADVKSVSPSMETAQDPGPQPPECGLYDICKGK